MNFAAQGFIAEPRQVARVLVVDDDPTMREMIVGYLHDQGMRAASAAGRQELGRQLGAFEPSLVILDLQLGQDDGLDLLREIRSRSGMSMWSMPVLWPSSSIASVIVKLS